MNTSKSTSSFSVLRVVIISLLWGIVAAGLIYMTDWKIESIEPLYYYVGTVLVIAATSTGLYLLSYKFRNNKKDVRG